MHSEWEERHCPFNYDERVLLNAICNYKTPKGEAEIANMQGNDEKLVVNSIGIYKSRAECIDILKFNIDITDDSYIKSLCEELLFTFMRITEEEWDELQKHMPFWAPFGGDDDEELEPVEHEPWTEEDMEEFKKIIEIMENESEQEEE